MADPHLWASPSDSLSALQLASVFSAMSGAGDGGEEAERRVSGVSCITSAHPRDLRQCLWPFKKWLPTTCRKKPGGFSSQRGRTEGSDTNLPLLSEHVPPRKAKDPITPQECQGEGLPCRKCEGEYQRTPGSVHMGR